MGHAAGLRAGTRVRCLLVQVAGYFSGLFADLLIVCLQPKVSREGLDQALDLPATIPVSCNGETMAGKI